MQGSVVTSGEIDLRLPYRVSYTDATSGTTTTAEGVINGDRTTGTGIDVESLRPGDRGHIVLNPAVAGHPAYLWLCGGIRFSDENGVLSQERGSSTLERRGGPGDRTGGEVEHALGAELLYVDPDSEDRQVLLRGSFADVLGTLRYGLALDATPEYDAPEPGGLIAPGEQSCFAGSAVPHLALRWWLPEETGNSIMTDRFEFELTFYALQCGHGDGTYNPCVGRKGISFVAFCVDDGDTLSLSQVSFSVAERNGSGEPIALEWDAAIPLRTVVLYYAGVFENFHVGGASSGAVSVGAGTVRLPFDPQGSPASTNGQSPSNPCPDGETGIKYDYEGGEFVRER
jgi:hypothetical protein